MKNVAKAVVILNAKKGQAGWSEAARKKAAMVRKRKGRKKSAGGGMNSEMSNEKARKLSLDFYEARREAGRGYRLIQDQVAKAYDYREKANSKNTHPNESEKYLVRADKLDAMIQRNEKRLKKLIKRYGIDKNPR